MGHPKIKGPLQLTFTAYKIVNQSYPFFVALGLHHRLVVGKYTQDYFRAFGADSWLLRIGFPLFFFTSVEIAFLKIQMGIIK